MALFKKVNGKRIQMKAQEEQEMQDFWSQEIIKKKQEKTDKVEADQQRETLWSAIKQKLSLSDEELALLREKK